MDVIALAYTLRTILGSLCSNRGLAIAIGVTGFCLLVRYAQLTSPDRDGLNVHPMGVLIGEPAMLLAIPAAGFLIDVTMQRRRRLESWWWRVPVELFLVYPVWIAFWVYMLEWMILGWVWL